MRKKCRKIVKYGLLLGIVLGTNVNVSYGYTNYVGSGVTVSDEEVETIEQWVASGGKTIRTTVNAGGAQAIDVDGLAEDTIINAGGEQRVVGTATGTIVNTGGTQKVSGTSSGATIDGGIQQIYINGTSSGDVIKNSGTQIINAGGTATNAILSAEGVQEIDAGGTATGTIVNTGGTQKVSGSSSGATIDGGSQQIYLGGTSTGATITNSGIQTIGDGGKATGATLSNGGAQVIEENGLAVGTIVNTGGTQKVSGSSSDATIDGGSQYIYVDGTSTGDIIKNSGTQMIYGGGTATGATLSAGGAQAIDVGGLAEGTIINDGGEQRVVGEATGTIVNTGGIQKVSGTSSGATIGGIQYIYGGGHSSSETIVNGGRQDIALGGESANARIDTGGNQSVWGTATGSIVSGDQHLYSGSTSNNVEVQNGGTIQIMESGASLTGQTKLDGGSIYMNNSSPGSFITTTMEHLEGTGSIHMNTNIAALQGDLITITGSTTGNFQVHLLNQGGAVVDPNQSLTLIDNQGGGGSFTLGSLVEVGGFKYQMGQNGNSWLIRSTQSPTSTSQAFIGGLYGNYLIEYAENQTLLQRLGDLRSGQGKGEVWGRVFGGKFTVASSQFVPSYDMSYSGMQVGGDRKISLSKDRGDIYLGATFGYLKGSQDYKVGHGSVDSKSLGLYGTFAAPTGFYADILLKYGWMTNDFKVLDTVGASVTGSDLDTNGASFSFEVGQRIYYKNQKEKKGWYVEPQAQISYSYQDGGEFKASNGLRFDVDSQTSILGRIGFLTGYEIKKGNHPINVYAKASYVHEFDGDLGFRLNNISASESFGDSWWTYGFGLTTQIGSNHNLYLDLERGSGGKFDQPWSISGGYRYQW